MRAATLTQSSPLGQQDYSAKALEMLFDQCFGERYRTRLIGGADEPFYQAAQGTQVAVIHYRQDYFRSALHEIAHWCVAGAERRAHDDYGYWYAPDGRNRQQQREFERVEVTPQAWELLFCAASGHPFKVSMDNLGNSPDDVSGFEAAVWSRAGELLRQLPRERGWEFVQAVTLHCRKMAGFQRLWIQDSFTAW